jgi:TRAP-type mannitol/chloroaromatic compound transport system permease small subunit
MHFLKRFISAVDFINDGIGRAVSFLAYPMIAVLVWEVFMRYLFNRPTIWAHELSALCYAVFFLLGGAYTLRWKAHINVDVLYVRLSPRSRAMLDLVTWLLFYFFCGVLLWQGSQAAWKSFMRLERASTVWEPYIWPVKFCIPLAALLMLLQGFTKTISDLYLAFTGRELLSENETGKRQ